LKYNKALCGLKQASLLWHATINKFLLSIGCIQAHADENLYLHSGIFLLLYVDDTQIFYPPSASEAAEELKTTLKNEYKMTDLGKVKQFLGLEIERHDSGAISLRQSNYIRTILKRFGMDDANSKSMPGTTKALSVAYHTQPPQPVPTLPLQSQPSVATAKNRTHPT